MTQVRERGSRQTKSPVVVGVLRLAQSAAIVLLCALAGKVGFGQQRPAAPGHAKAKADTQHVVAPDAKLVPPADQKIDAKDLATRALANEVTMVSHDGMYLRYRLRKVEDKGDSLRDVIESKEGTVARLIQRNGRPLTPEEDQAELVRMNAMLAHPGDFTRHQRKEQAEMGRAQALLRLVPQALIFEVASPQQPLPGASALDPTIIELTFRPNPAFRPPTFEAQVLKAVVGRVWINRQAQENVRVEANIASDAAFGWGLLGKLYKGGSVTLDLADAGGRHWIMTRLRESLTVRALFKTINLNVKEDLGYFTTLPTAMSYQDAIRVLEKGPAGNANATIAPPIPPAPSRELSRAAP